ncbi:MAG TPA: acyl-CoA dehydrogenase family protein [Mycobacterium sp.]|nr:acyl-CoA dehydrogenase family protein [Mycobacterium sp.]
MEDGSAEFAEFHHELRSVAADVLARDRTVDWATLVDAGWVGLEVPDEFGGSAATFAEVAVICEELGRATGSTRYLGSAVLPVGMLNTLQASDIRDGLLADIASGAIRVAVAIGSFTLSADRRLTGRAGFVPDADGADRLLALATDPAGTAVIVDVAGLVITPQPVLDETRRVATVTADGVVVPESAVLRFAGDAGTGVRRLLDRASVAVACDSLGLADAMLAATVSYAQVRHQFGRPIGSFQAVKHACADMLVKISVARALVRSAVEAVAGNQPDADVAAAMAKAYACGVAVDVVGKAMQLHGGIGYTWEGGIHVYLKRAAFNRSLFGSPAAHRKHLARRYQ